LISAFSALRSRHYRWLWLGGLAGSAGFQMSSVAQGWLVYRLTGSALALGWVSSGWSLTMLLLSPYGGVVCDRVEKRDLLLWTRGLMGLNILVIALLISAGAIQVWHLLASALFSGVLFSFMFPAYQTIIPKLVDRDTLLNAFSLDAVGMGLMGIIGAPVAGMLIDHVGVAGVYYAMAFLYFLSVPAMSRLPATNQKKEVRNSAWLDLREGTHYILRQPVLLGLLSLALARVIFAMPYTTLMPKFAREVMGFEGTGLGLLVAAPGVGSLIGSLAVASLGNYRDKGKLLLASGVGTGLGLFLFVTVRPLPLVLFFLALVGAAGNISMVANSALLQANAEDHLRGRVMSVYLMMWGLTPLGTLPAGAVADRLGVPPVVALEGLLLATVFLAVMFLQPQMRRLE